MKDLLIIFKRPLFANRSSQYAVIKNVKRYEIVGENRNLGFYVKDDQRYFVPMENVVFFGWSDDAEAFGIKLKTGGDKPCEQE